MDTYKHTYTGRVFKGCEAIIVITVVFKVILRSLLGSKVKTWTNTKLGWGSAIDGIGGIR